MIVWLEDTNVHSVLAEPALGKGGYHVVRDKARKVLVISPAEFDQLSWCGPWEEVVLFNSHETDIDQGIEPDERDDLASCWT